MPSNQPNETTHRAASRGPKIVFAFDPQKTSHVFSTEVLERIESRCTVISRQPLTNFSIPAARGALADAEILLTGWGAPMVTPEVLRMAPKLRLIVHAAGTVKFTVDPATFESGVRVTHSAEANAVPVAEFTLAAILFSNKRIFELRNLYCADPSRASCHKLMNSPIGNYGRTVGLVGASRIGRKVAQMLTGFDLRVMLYDPFVRHDDPVLRYVELVELDKLMACSDTVSIHAPSLPSTHRMINRRLLESMRDGATLINTARGALVDQAALLSELRSGRIHAVLDVTDPEIPSADSEFYTLPNVFLTPHVAGAIGAERTRLGIMAADEIERFISGTPLLYEIEPSVLERLA